MTPLLSICIPTYNHAELLDRALARLTSLPAFASGDVEVALSDKKRKGDTLTLVVPCAFGESTLRPVPVNELADWARAGLDA